MAERKEVLKKAAILRLVDALGVVILTPAIQEFLEENDPKCLEQCISAVRNAEVISGRAKAVMKSKARQYRIKRKKADATVPGLVWKKGIPQQGKPVRCSLCGRPNPVIDDGYTSCCGEPQTYSSYSNYEEAEQRWKKEAKKANG